MTACADKVAYLSEYLATNAATLHRFVHPNCCAIEPYACKHCDSWHIGHLHPNAGDRCKAEPPVHQPQADPMTRTWHICLAVAGVYGEAIRDFLVAPIVRLLVMVEDGQDVEIEGDERE